MIRLLMITALLSTALAASAQNPLAAAYSQDNIAECLEKSQAMLLENPADSTALFFQGLCLIKNGDYSAALSSLKKAEAANFQPLPACQAQQALCLSQLEQKKEALSLLESISKGGFSNYQVISQDQFAPLHENASFQAIRDTIHRRAFPCYYDPNYTHFDFWLGEWDVFVGELKAGDSKITKQDGGCAILEQYTTARDYVGQSLNFYDASDGLWKQFWIDKTKGISKYVESKRGPGLLQYISTEESAPAGYANLRMTFSKNEDGSVRQLIEQKQQGEEESWQIVFDGRYVRKQAKDN